MTSRASGTSKASGALWEQRALHYLEGQGLHLLARNFRTPMGELDLVMLDAECLVFVEVRQRRQSRFGDAAMSVTAPKQQRLTRAAGAFIQRHRQYQKSRCRFDVIAYDIGDEPDAPPRWIRNAFAAA